MVSLSKGQRPFHVTLEDRSQENRVPLYILQDEDGKLLYEWTLAPALAPDVPQPDVSYGQYTPDIDLNWSQEDWSGGGLSFYYSADRPNRYGLADGVWALTPNELALGVEAKEVSYGIKNGGAQLNATTGWSTSGVTLTAISTAPHAGPYHFQLASTSTNDYINQDIVDATDQPAARWQSQAITVIAMVRGTAAGGAMRVQIVESGGASTPTTSGSAVTLTTSYQQISVTVTLQSDSTGIDIRINCSTDGGADITVYVDSVNVYAGSAIPNASHVRMMVQTDGSAVQQLIAVTDRAVWKFNEDEDYWMLQNVAGAAITGAEVFDDQLFLGQGESTVYKYSNAGDPTTYTASNLGGTLDNANRFVKTLNANGSYVLAKTLDDDNVHLAVDPTNTGTWGQAIEVGKDDHKILQVFDMDGTMAVGKEDGFYQYLSLQGNRFQNIWAGAGATIAADNFTRGLMYGGYFYTILGETGFWRYSGTTGWEALGHIIQSPGFDEIGDRVRAFGTDGEWLLLVVEDLNADSITKECWLLAAKEFVDTGWVVHTLKKFVMSDAIDMMVHKVSGGTNRFLYINGDINDQPFTQRIQLPNRTSTPRLATNKDLPLSGTLITEWMDWNRPNVDKVANRFTALSESLTSTQTITVAYEFDNETSFTNINSSGSVFSTSPKITIAFNENVKGKKVRYRFTFTTDDTSKTGVMKAYSNDVTWRPPRLKRWNILAALEDRVAGTMGVPTGIPVSRLLVRLALLKDEIPPLRITDIDGTLHRGHIIDMAETQYQVHPAQAALRYSRAIRLTIAQALTISAEPWDSGIRWNEFGWG